MKMIDITGKDPLVPVCPNHKNVALIPENRSKVGGELFGFWRCPIDNKVYREDTPYRT